MSRGRDGGGVDDAKCKSRWFDPPMSAGQSVTQSGLSVAKTFLASDAFLTQKFSSFIHHATDQLLKCI